MVELMMVVAIIAILIAIAIPMFLGASAKAEDRQAETILHSSLVAARIGAADTGDYAWITPTTMQNEEHSVTFVGAATAARATVHEVSLSTGLLSGTTYVIMATLSSSGKCYALLENTSQQTTYQVFPAASCSAGSLDPLTGWSSTW